jgi:heme A synthase
MKNPWLHRFAILLAMSALLLIVDGALLGAGTQLHIAAATMLGVLTLGSVVWLMSTDWRPESRRLGWLTLAIAVVEGAAGLPSVQALAPHAAGILHAVMAPLFFATLVGIAVVTSPAWSRGPEFVTDYGWPSIRSLSILTPALVLLQIVLGAAFRQKTLTLLPHVLGAMFVALVILLESIFVLQQFPSHRALRTAAKTLLGIAFGQVFLGLMALIMKSMTEETDLAAIISVAAHITGGALTLAVTMVLSILIGRNVQPRVEEDLEESPAS